MAKRSMKVTQVRRRAVEARRHVQETAQINRSQLHEERERLITIFESISDAFMSVDREYRFTYLNPQAVKLFQRLTGQSADYFIGKAIWEAFADSYNSHFGDAYRRAMTQGTSVQLEAFFQPLDAWFDVRVYPSKEGLSIYLADVTSRHRAQDGLRAAEERLRMMIDSAKDYAIFSLDPQGNVTSWSTGAERIFGYPEAEILGQTEELIYTPEDIVARIPEREMHKAVEVGYSENERWHRRKDQRRVYCSGMIRPIRDEGGNLKGFIKVARDTTEAKLAEQRNQLLQDLTTALSASLTVDEVVKVVLDKSLEAVGGNAGGVYQVRHDEPTIELLGTSGIPDEGQELYHRVPLDVAIPLTDAIRNRDALYIETMEDYMQAYPHLQEQIQLFNVHAILCLPFYTHNQAVGGVYLGFTQPRIVSKEERALLGMMAQLCGQALERARLYDAEKQARQLAEKANELKMQFLAMISHELRTPLASIKGFTTTLLAQDIAFDPEEQLTFLRIVNDETDKLTELVEQLLDLSRLQAGTLRIDPSPQSFDNLLKVAQTQLQTLTERHPLVLHVPDSLPLVVADKYRIGQVLVNLIENAAKFSPDGTPITVEASENDEGVQVDVMDQGAGIPPEDRKKVFEAFRQVDRKIPNQSRGARLGLAICKGIVEAHGGRIWVQDREVGTTISFVLPTALIKFDDNRHA